MRCRWFLPLVGVMLVGCATFSPPIQRAEPSTYQPHLQKLAQIRAFELRGHIGVQTDKKGFSGLLRWQHRSAGDEMDLYSPLGSQVAQIRTAADGVTLITSDRKIYHAADAETLTEQNMGWRLPLSGLNDWVLGRPAMGAVEILAWDEAGRIAHLRQNGWDIEYAQYLESGGQQLPTRIIMKSVKLDLKLVLDQWETETQWETNLK
jgi:outer membrane lipoprotein LolB